MTHRLRGGYLTNDRRLDRLPQFDVRSRGHDIRTLVEDKPLKSRGWNVPAVLDQGSEGACVGFSWTHELIATPKRVILVSGRDRARQLYKRAQQLDQWEGEQYSGTSVLAGAKAVLEGGWITSYRWAFTYDDVLRAVAYEGPVVLGIDWYEGMYNPGSNGYLSVTGQVVGGHAILCSAVHLAHKRVVLHNSWGRDWGMEGKAYLRFDRLFALLDAGGECCCPQGRRL